MKKFLSFLFDVLLIVSTILVMIYENCISKYLYLSIILIMGIKSIISSMRFKKKWFLIASVIGSLLIVLNSVLLLFFPKFLLEHYTFAFILKMGVYIILIAFTFNSGTVNAQQDKMAQEKFPCDESKQGSKSFLLTNKSTRGMKPHFSVFRIAIRNLYKYIVEKFIM